MLEAQIIQFKEWRPFILPLVFGVGVFLTITGCGSRGTLPLGVHDGKLSGCPDSPNCVSTESTDDKHSIAPLTFVSPPGDALDCLKRIITSMKRTKIVTTEGSYIRAEFRTLLGFVDDLEFFADERTRTIQMRSASRVGYSDLGVNRRRVEEIRARFERECK